MEDEINIEESCAILNAVKLFTRLRSSIASYSYSHRLDSSCARRLTRARDTVSQYLDRGSLLHREEIRSTEPRFLSLSFYRRDRSRYRREEERKRVLFLFSVASDFAPPRGYEIRLRPRPRSEIPLIRLRPIAICFSTEISLRVRFFRLKKKKKKTDEINARNASSFRIKLPS